MIFQQTDPFLDQEFQNLSKQIKVCSYCQKAISLKNIVRHERQCLQRNVLLKNEASIFFYPTSVILPFKLKIFS
jgi:hypothetical protein